MNTITKTNTMQVTTASSKWLLPFPSDAKFPRITGIYDSEKKPANWHYTVNIVNSFLEVDFGFDNYSGYVVYEWEEESLPGEEVPLYPDSYRRIVINDVTEIEFENSTFHGRGVKVFKLLQETSERKTYEDITDTIILRFSKNNNGHKYITVISSVKITGFIELY